MHPLSLPLERYLSAAPVIPVIVIDRLEDAAPLARALVAGGLSTLEITLRTPVALEAIQAMRTALQDLPHAVVGAGTVLDEQQYIDAVNAGAQFVVSPGLTDRLINTARQHRVPLLPGTATASEVMRAREAGYTLLKFFPAAAMGGVSTLTALASVFPDVRFCPTGGITLACAPSYLALPNVVCVGGSWPLPAQAIHTRDWARIEHLARLALALAPSTGP